MDTHRDYRSDRQLLSAGISQDVLNAVRSTTVVTHNGAQHVIPESQKNLFGNEEVTVQVESNAKLQNLQMKFSRFKQMTDNKIMKLESQLSIVLEQIAELQSKVMTVESNARARGPVPEKRQSQPLTKAIDRTGTPPAEVSVEKMFYCGMR